MAAVTSPASPSSHPSICLQDKTTALVSAQAGRLRAEEQAQAVRTQLEQCQTALQRVQAQLRAAEQRAAPGAMVPVEQHQQVLCQLDELQQRYDALERQHAALQRQAQAGRAVSPGSSAEREPAVCDSPQVPGTSRMGTATAAAAVSRSISSPVPCGASLRASKAYCPGAYGGVPAVGSSGSETVAQLQAQLLSRDVRLMDAQLQREQAVAEAERQRQRLHGLLACLSPHPHDAAAAEAIAEARQLAGLPGDDAAVAVAEGGGGRGGAPGSAAAAAAGGAAGRPTGKGASAGTARRRGPSGREQELLDTIALLKSALERTKKGLESG